MLVQNQLTCLCRGWRALLACQSLTQHGRKQSLMIHQTRILAGHLPIQTMPLSPAILVKPLNSFSLLLRPSNMSYEAGICHVLGSAPPSPPPQKIIRPLSRYLAAGQSGASDWPCTAQDGLLSFGRKAIACPSLFIHLLNVDAMLAHQPANSMTLSISASS